MTLELRRPGLALTALLALLAATTVFAWAGPDATALLDDRPVADDDQQRVSRAVFVTEDGETHEVSRDETYAWAASDDDGERRIARAMFVTEDGEVHELTGDAAYAWAAADSDGDRRVVRKVFVSEDGEARELTGDEADTWVMDLDELGEGLENLRHLEGLAGLEGLEHLEGLGDHLAVALGEGGPFRVHRFHHGGPFPRRGALLGIEMTPMSPELRAHFGAPEDAGTMVSRVIEGSAAEAAGLRVGDVVTRIDGDPVDSPAAMAMLVGRHQADDVVQIDVVRDGVPETFTATLRKWEPELDHGHGPVKSHKVVVICKDGEDCDVAKDLDVPCGDAENCRIEVQCNGGDCDCTVNGDSVDCEQLPGH